MKGTRKPFLVPLSSLREAGIPATTWEQIKGTIKASKPLYERLLPLAVKGKQAKPGETILVVAR